MKIYLTYNGSRTLHQEIAPDDEQNFLIMQEDTTYPGEFYSAGPNFNACIIKADEILEEFNLPGLGEAFDLQFNCAGQDTSILKISNYVSSALQAHIEFQFGSGY